MTAAFLDLSICCQGDLTPLRRNQCLQCHSHMGSESHVEARTSRRCSTSNFRQQPPAEHVCHSSPLFAHALPHQDPKDPTGAAIEYAYQNSWGLTQRTIGVMAGGLLKCKSFATYCCLVGSVTQGHGSWRRQRARASTERGWIPGFSCLRVRER